MSERDVILNCNFSFRCPKQWDTLEPTAAPDHRFCQSCERDVYFVRSIEEFEKAAIEGRCVASNTVLPDHPEEIFFVLGKPSPPPRESNLDIVDAFVEAVRFGDLTQAFGLLIQLEEVDRPWGFNKIAAAYETTERFDRVLAFAQNGNIQGIDLAHLAIMLAERGMFEQSIALVNCIKPGSYLWKDEALTLAKIAAKICKTGNFVQASNLIDRSFRRAQKSWTLTTSKEFAEEFAQELEEMRLRELAESSEAQAEIVILAAEAGLQDKAIQLAQVIELASTRERVIQVLKCKQEGLNLPPFLH